ncbi:MAG: PKD domain-containing protein [Bacteroidota bacterium]
MRKIFLILSFFTTIYGFSQPIANFTVSHTIACVGDTVTMTSTSTLSSEIVNYIWSAQGAVVDSYQGPNATSFSFVYSNPGTFSFSLIVQDQDGGSSTKVSPDAIVIHPNPVATIVSSNLSCTLPFQLSFSNTGSTTGSEIQSNWQFPSGSPATFTGNQTSVSYANEGNFTASLTILNTTTGCFDTELKPLILTDFIADFEVPATFCKGVSIQLFDSTSTGVNQWTWTSSGGTITNSTSQNPFITFNQAGTFTITLTANNTSASCQDIITKTITVTELPVVSYNQNLTFGCADKTVVFSNTTPNAAGSTFIWDFGDGTPAFTGLTPPPHNYLQNNKMFFPVLTRTDANGCVNTFTGDTIYFFPPEAHMTATPPLGCAPMLVQFTDVSYSPEQIVSWLWNFDDGTTSTLQNPTHSFPCGTYNVSLTITTVTGCTDITFMTDQILNLAGASVTTVQDNIFIFKQMSDSTVFRNFSNNGSNDFQYPTIRYGEIVNNTFTYTPSLACQNEPFIFTGIAPTCPPENDIEYTWHFEGFGTGTSVEPVFTKIFFDTLHTTTPIDVGLEADYRGCITPLNTLTDIIYLKGPVSNFLTSGTFCNIGPGPHTINVDDSQSIYGHIGDYIFEGTQVVEDQDDDDVDVLYVWGDGTSDFIDDDNLLEDANKGAISHIYNGYGTYVIKQYITNHTTACIDSSEQTIHISFIDADLLINDSLCRLSHYTIPVTSDAPADHATISYHITRNGVSTGFPSTGIGQTNLAPTTSPFYFVENTAGFTTIDLVATNSVGCQATVTKIIRVLELPTADITLIDDTVCIGALGFFTPENSSHGDFQNGWLEFQWTINNNEAYFESYDLDTQSYIVNNQINVSLVVVDSFGCVSNNIATKTIKTQKPTASFSTNQYLCNDINELMDGSASIGNEPLTYEWFLDGVPVPNSNTDSLYNVITVSPPDILSKNYTYTLIVTDDRGCQDVLDKNVYVSNPRVDSVATVFSATSVDLSGNFTCPDVYTDFDLYYTSDQVVTDFQWSFGNDFDTDIDSYNQNPSGTQYYQAGSYAYSVLLTEPVTGCIFGDSLDPFLTIGGPTAELLVTPDPLDICGLRFMFQILNPSDNLDEWTWSLGDGTIVSSLDSANTFYHTFLDADHENPSIIIKDSASGCDIKIPNPIEIYENSLDALFTINPENPIVELDMLFDDFSTTNPNSPIVSWFWDFGDGTTLNSSNSNSVNHVYLNEDSQLVTLTITDNKGCTDQYSLPIDLFTVNLVLPNIITNAGNKGVNSWFSLFEDIFSDYELIIVNRWGNVVQKSNKDPLNPLYLWNGRDYKSDEICSDGVYFYVIEGRLINGKQVKLQDFLTLSGGKF